MQNTEIVKTLIDNPSLVLIKVIDGVASSDASVDEIPAMLVGGEYYLATQKQYKICMQWINGRDVVSVSNKRSRTLGPYMGEWRKTSCFMDDNYTLELKSKKEKRWIAYSSNQKRLGNLSFDSEREIRAHYIHEIEEPQFIEIEVEV